MAFNAGN